jgi:hypothetical protein
MRAEGVVSLAVDQSIPIVDGAVRYHTKGPLHRDSQQHFFVKLSDIERSMIANDVEQGFVPEVELLSHEGVLLKKQHVYPNNALSYRNYMIHRLNQQGLAAHFTLTAEEGYEESFVEMLEFGEAVDDEPELVLPLNFELYNSEFNTEVSVTYLMLPPGFDDEGNVVPVRLSSAQGVIVVRDTDTRAKIIDDDLNVGDTIEIFDDLSLTLEKITYSTSLAVVDDWSVNYLYILFALSTLALAVALLTSPAVTVVGMGADGKTYAYARFFRPSAYTSEDIYEALRVSQEKGSHDEL